MICPTIGKPCRRRGREVRRPLGQIDRIQHLPGDDEVGIASGLAREGGDEVGDRPLLIGLQGVVAEPRHRCAVEPGRHRPVDVLARRSSTERPALREIRRAYRLTKVVDQGWRRRSIAAAERAVAFDAAGFHVEFLPELDGFVRDVRRARERDGLRDTLGLREVGGKGLDEVREVRHVLVGEAWPGGHRGVRHAALDDIHEILMGRKRAGWRRPDLVLATREVPRLRVQVRSGVASPSPFSPWHCAQKFEVELSCPPPAARRFQGRGPARAPIRSARSNEAIRTARHQAASAADTSARQSAAGHLCRPPWREASAR